MNEGMVLTYRKYEHDLGEFRWTMPRFAGTLVLCEERSIRESVPVNGVVLDFGEEGELVSIEFLDKDMLPPVLKRVVECPSDFDVDYIDVD